MPIEHKVEQGDCLSSIAFQYGFFPATLWDDPANAKLKALRKDPNVLLPGDIVIVPDKRPKRVSVATNQVHPFRRKGVPERLRLQLLVAGKPRANEPYKLDIDGSVISGTTDGDGMVVEWIPPDAKQCRLILEDGAEEYDLDLAHLDPLRTITGAQGRLRHLGFYSGPIDGNISLATEHAIQEFQLSQEIEPDGELNDATLAALEKAYGR